MIDYIKQRAPESDVLRQLSEAVLAAESLGEVADHLIGHFVDQARRSGASWTEIGQSMGVSKQAAQKRFVPKDQFSAADIAREFGRYTDRARQVVVAAQQAAFDAGNELIGTEHLLAGLLQVPEGLAAKAIVKFGAPIEEVSRLLGARFGPSVELTSEQLAFSVSAKKVLELTLREALRLGHNYIGTEHLLLAMLEFGEGAGPEVLAEVGVEKQAVEEELMKVLAAVLKKQSELSKGVN